MAGQNSTEECGGFNGLISTFEKINLILRQTNKIVVCQSKIVIANRNS